MTINNTVKNTLVILLTLVILILLLTPKSESESTSTATSEDESIIFIKNSEGKTIRFNVEVAKTAEQRKVGLRLRRSLPEENGMLFIMNDEHIVEMWMKNTYIPLDMIFIGRDSRIKHIAKNATPNSTKTISSHEAVIAVLEINAILTDKLSIKEGNLVSHPGIK